MRGASRTSESTNHQGFIISIRLKAAGLSIPALLIITLLFHTQVFSQYRNPDSTGPTEQGLSYSYFEGSWTSLPDFSALGPAKTDTCTSFDLTQVPHRAENFGIVFAGFIDIVFDGDYTFYTSSKDGSALLIGDSVVVSNDGLHASPAEKSGVISLATGKHKITVRFFGTVSPLSLSASYECSGLGISKRVIPPESLWRPYTGPLPAITITSPKTGDSYALGDTLTVEWTFTKGVNHSVFVDMSLDNGKSFFLIKTSAYIMTTEAGLYKYVIPEDDSTFITNQALVWIGDYIVGGTEGMSGKFSIVPKSAVRYIPLEKSGRPELVCSGNIVRYTMANVSKSDHITLTLFNMKGAMIPLIRSNTVGAPCWIMPENLAGTYAAVLSINGARQAYKLLFFGR